MDNVTSSGYIQFFFATNFEGKSKCYYINISSSDVYIALSTLDPTKGFGCDNVHPRILKYCALALVEPISNLVSRIVAFQKNENCIKYVQYENGRPYISKQLQTNNTSSHHLESPRKNNIRSGYYFNTINK